MTDVMSEEFGRALVERTTFEKEAVWLPLLAVHALNVGNGVIRGKTFTDCVLEGPALVAAHSGVTLEDCNLGLAEDPRSLFYKPQGPVLVGAIVLVDCTFVRCRFVQVAFTGPDEFIAESVQGLLAARSKNN